MVTGLSPGFEASTNNVRSLRCPPKSRKPLESLTCTTRFFSAPIRDGGIGC